MRGFAAVIAMLKSQFSPIYISGLEIKKNNFQFVLLLIGEISVRVR